MAELQHLTKTDAPAAAPGPEASARDPRASWTDSRLVQAVSGDVADAGALDVLVARHWKALYGRCRLLTLDADAANDLAQETWTRVLQARRTLCPDLNFVGFLVTVARNIWLDQHRAAQRAGPLSEERLARLDDAASANPGEVLRFADTVPDRRTMRIEDDTALRLDVDRALARLTPMARDLITARFLDGESAAEIGARYGRTEQTITAWLRMAIRDVRTYFDAAVRASATEESNAP